MSYKPFKSKDMEQLIADFYRLLERYAEFTQVRYLYDSRRCVICMTRFIGMTG